MRTSWLTLPAALLLLVAACGNDNGSSKATKAPASTATATSAAAANVATSTASTTAPVAPPASVAATQPASRYATKQFVVPLDVEVLGWLPPTPSVDEPNFVTWEASDAERAVRVLVPVSVYQPGSTVAVPPPNDYLTYLLGQVDHGAHFADITKTTIGGKPATVVTATTDTSLDGSIGCSENDEAAPDCFGLQPDLSLRIAVVDTGEHTLLIWLREPAGDPSADISSFTTMLASVRFDEERAPSTVATAGPAAAATEIDGTWATSFTKEELMSSPLLYGGLNGGEVNDENWGQLTFTFAQGRFVETQKNPVTTSSGDGTFNVQGDTITLKRANGEQFVMRWKLVGNQLTFSRDTTLGTGPTPFVVKPWTRQP
jgi:hypothetical protein